MRRSPIRWGLFAAAVLTFSVGTVAVFPTPSYAAVPSITTMGGQINVLPSAVRAASSASGSLSQADMMAIYIYRASKSPEFWALWDQAKRTSVSTGKDLVLSPEVAAEAKTIYPTASKVAPLVKTAGKAAGTAGAVLTAYEVGSKVTNGTLDLLGIDATGTVCSSTGRDLWGAIVQGAAGADCSGYDQKIADSFTPNADAAGGLSSVSLCDPQGVRGCISVYGSYEYNATRSTYCVAVRGGTGEPANAADNWQNYSLVYTTNGTLSAVSGTAYSDSGRPSWFGCTPPSGARAIGVDSDTNKPLQSIGFTEDKMVPVRESTGDPDRTLKCVIAGTDGNTYATSSDTFKESSGVLPDVSCPDLPAGVIADETKVVETGGDGGDDTIWNAKTDPAVRDALTKYGDCGTTTQCKLELTKNGKSCFGETDCAGWYTEADKSAYRCTYGSYAVSMDECTVYANRWEPEAQTTGNNLSDPSTGKPLKNPKPQLQPGTTASVSDSPNDATLGPNKCFQNMSMTLNPISWVVEPLKCLFVPRQEAIDADFATLNKQASKSMPGAFLGMVGAWDFQMPATNCNGLPLRFQSPQPDLVPFDTGTFYVGAACDGVMAQVALDTRIIFDFACIITALMSIGFYIARTFGWEGLGGSA